MPRISGIISAGHLYNMTPKRICTIFQLQYYALKLWFVLSLSFPPPFHSNCSWCVTLQKSHPCKYRHTFLLLNNGTFFSLHVLLVFTKLYFQDLELNHLRPGLVWLTGSKKENLNLKECLGNKNIGIKTPEYLRNVYISWVCLNDKLYLSENA